MSVEFMHEVSSIKNLDNYERRLEQRRQERMRIRNLWSNIFRTEDTPEVLEFPPSRELFSSLPSGRHMRLFSSRIYIREDLVSQIPDELMPRIQSDSITLAQVPDEVHDQRTELTTRNFCGVWQIMQAVLSWSTMEYRCYGCGRMETINGNPTHT